MTRFVHDQFAKDLLDELLGHMGTVNPAQEVASEVKQIDFYFTPSPEKPDYLEYKEKLGLLGKMATTPALFEPFRNGVTVDDIQSCMSKLLDVTAKLKRQARRENTTIIESELPFLWILTPTASASLLKGFKATADEKNWGKGIYFFGKHWRGAIVVIHQLPKTSETLWLRILGKGKVQAEAITSLGALPVDDPWRVNVLNLVYQLQLNLRVNQSEKSELEAQEDENLIMAIAPLFQEQLQAAEQKGIERGIQQGIERGVQEGIQQGLQQGIQQGRQEGREEGIQQGKQEGIQQGLERGRQEQQRLILDNFLGARFGELDEKMTNFIPSLSTLPAADFTRMLLSISLLPVDENGRQEVMRLEAENVLRLRRNELGDILPTVVSNLLELSGEELRLLLERLPQLSTDELINLLGERRE
ncbi:MAG TPA: flagellar assembly protein H [Cyanobacteria bacterium UBA9226]|nr:flagellar assembly protein H [Cyanobacteria bacterium UBA9226]